jgi:hypothetical protein
MPTTVSNIPITNPILGASQPDTSDAAEAIEAVAATVADPGVLSVLHDLSLAHSIYTDVKTKLAKLPPSNQNRIVSILKAIFE